MSIRILRPVLVVDDDPDIRRVLTEVLEDEGYRVITASDGQRALDLIGAETPGLVLLDLQMPILNGWEVLARLREQHVPVPVVFMTAGMRARDEAQLHGADGYLAKPFDLFELVRVVARFKCAA